nr:hypothetical protein [Bradyrhizobium japonicum]
MDGAGAEQRAVPRAKTAFVQPDRNLLGAERTRIAVAITREIERTNDDLGFDRFDGQFLLLLASDDFGVDRLVSEWNDAAIGIAAARVFFHGAGGRARGLRGLEFIHDANEFAEQVSACVLGERLGQRNQLNLVLAQSAHRKLLLKLVSERPRERVDENCVDRPRTVGCPRDHLLATPRR